MNKNIENLKNKLKENINVYINNNQMNEMILNNTIFQSYMKQGNFTSFINDEKKLTEILFIKNSNNINIAEALINKNFEDHQINNIIESLFELSKKVLQLQKEENLNNLKITINSVIDKFGIQHNLIQVLEELSRNPESLSYFNIIKIDGKYGTSRDLKQTNGELYSNIINLFKGIISNYSNAQKSLDNKIKILNDLNMKIGLDIKEFNF